MKVFVTGSTGLLGSNLVRGLVAQGDAVKALARSAEKAEKLLGDLPIEIVEGDMQDVAHFAPELKGCDVLFHVAAYFREYYGPGEHDDLLNEINVVGTIRLLEAAVEHGVEHVIYVSSAGVLGQPEGGGVVDESAPYNHATPNLYFQSKIAAEKAVYEFLEGHDLRVVLILPGVIFGPGDSGPSTAGQTVLDFLNRQIPVILPGGLWVVDARDVAQGMIQAVTVGQSGERFLIGGRYFPVGAMLTILEKISGVAGPRQKLPYPAALAIAWVSEFLSGFTGKPPQLSEQAVRVLQDKSNVSSEKAIKELGITFRSLEDTLGDQVAWFRANGYLSQAAPAARAEDGNG